MPDSLLEKLSAAIGSAHVGVAIGPGQPETGYVTRSSADQLAQTVLAVVREHDKARGRSEPDGTRVTVAQLAAALKGSNLVIVGDSGANYIGRPKYPEAVAESILEDITGRAHPMPAPDGAADPMACPDCGTRHPPETREALTSRLTIAGQAADPEIDAIAAVKDALRPLSADAQMRIARYWVDRLQGGAIADDDPF